MARAAGTAGGHGGHSRGDGGAGLVVVGTGDDGLAQRHADEAGEEAKEEEDGLVLAAPRRPTPATRVG